MYQSMLIAVMTFVCVACCSFSVHGMDATSLAMQGGNMTPEDASSLEKSLELEPDNVTARTKLLGYYQMKKFSDGTARASHEANVLWLIRNKPRSEVLGVPFAHLDPHLNPNAYREAEKVWLEHLEEHPDDLEILEYSSAFFLIHSRERAEQSLLKGQSLEPKDPKWPSKLGQLYSLGTIKTQSRDEKKAMAAKSLEQLEIAYELSVDEARDSMLSQLAKVALESENVDVAKKYATKMLNQQTGDWNTGNNVFHGNTILGRIALQEKDVQKAKEHLLAAGKTSGSPQLDSFGPNMTLAKELIEADETEVVLEFFDLCSKFWKRGKPELEQWASDVKAGDVPAFGSNLNY